MIFLASLIFSFSTAEKRVSGWLFRRNWSSYNRWHCFILVINGLIESERVFLIKFFGGNGVLVSDLTADLMA